MKLIAAFSILNRIWQIRKGDPPVETITSHNGNIFLGRSNQLQWFKPSSDQVKGFQERWFPRSIQRIVVNPKSLLIGLSPENLKYVSESMVFAKGKTQKIKWEDNTLFETVVGDEKILRSNYFGDLSIYPINDDDDSLEEDLIMSKIKASAMTIHGKYLWTAVEQHTRKGQCTRVDAIDLSSLNTTYTFYIDSNKASHPVHLSVMVQECFPNNALYIVVGYMRGGVYAGHVYFPPENEKCTLQSHHLPNDDVILSMCFDFPFIHTLTDKCIETYRFPAVMSIPQYLGAYYLPRNYYSVVNQIACVKRQVFWNGQETLQSVEISD